MPRNDPQPTWISVSFLQLCAKIQGGTVFTVDDLVSQMDKSDRSGDDFRISHNQVNYVVPIDQIREYFATHPRPKRQLTVQEELESLRRENKELQARLAEHGLLDPEPVFDEQPKFEKKGHIPPPSRPDPKHEIPVAGLGREKQSIEEIQGDLLTDLRGKKPITRDDPLVQAAKVTDRPTV